MIGTFVLAAGCVSSPRTPVAYTTQTPAPSYPPASDSSAVRVYPDTRRAHFDSTTPSTTSSDLAIAYSIRDVLKTDIAMAAAARHVDIEVVQGAATLRGTVPSENDRQMLQERIAAFPGIISVDNRLKLELPSP